MGKVLNVGILKKSIVSVVMLLLINLLSSCGGGGDVYKQEDLFKLSNEGHHPDPQMNLYKWRHFISQVDIGVRFTSKSEPDSSVNMMYAQLDAIKAQYPEMSDKTEEEQIEIFKDILYKQIGLKFESNPDVLNAVLPYKTIVAKRSTCVGSVMLGLLVGEMFEFPIKPVLFANHVFWKWDGDIVEMNLEPNREGWSYSDEEYLEKYPGTTSDDFLKNTDYDFKSVYLYTMGNIFSKADMSREAVWWYQKALLYNHMDPAINLNFAISLSGIGRNNSAIKVLKKVYNEDYDFLIAYNLGMLYIKLGKLAEADKVFEDIEEYGDDEKEQAEYLAKAIEHAKESVKE